MISFVCSFLFFVLFRFFYSFCAEAVVTASCVCKSSSGSESTEKTCMKILFIARPRETGCVFVEVGTDTTEIEKRQARDRQ